MNTLVVDTSTPYLIVGVQTKDAVFKSQTIVSKKHSEKLISTVDSVLDEANLGIKDIGRIVVANGPGSYTGVRIAITFVKTLALVYPNVDVYTVNTLLGFVGVSEGFVFLDARSGRVFGGYASNGSLNDVRVHELNTIDSESLYGDVQLLGHDTLDFDGVDNYLAVESSWEKVEDVDKLVPVYLK